MLPNTSPQPTEVTSSAVQNRTETPVQPAATTESDALRNAVTQTQQLIARASSNPYELSNGLQQLKSAYLAQQYHIGPNSNEL